MSATATAQATTNEARAPLAAPENAARTEVKPPEHSAIEQAAIVPPEVKMPISPPPVHAVSHTMAANDPMAEMSLAVEQQLAAYFAARIKPELTNGLKLSVVVDHSNRITGGANAKQLMDVSLLFEGNALNAHDTASQLRDEVVKHMVQHPAFAGYDLQGTKNDVLRTLSLSMTGLSQERFAELLKPHPLTVAAPAVKRDEVGHACVGADCSHCASPAKAETAQPSIEAVATTTAPVAENTAVPAVTAAASVPAPSVAEAKPEGLAVVTPVPANLIATPAVNEATLAPEKQLANGATR